jgi:hypothetical protein
MQNRYFAILSFLALAFLLISQPASAEEAQPGVGRVSVINGEVSTQRGDSGDWVATTVNAPVVPGDSVSAGARSRAEVQLDYANILRLDQSTVAKIADLQSTRIQVQVAQGMVNFDVLKGSGVQAEIDTPNVAVSPLGEGRYRIEVDSNNQTRVTVREGEAEVSTPQGSTHVKKGELITIAGTDNPQYQIASAPGKDEWDNWNKDRDHVVEDADSWQHTNRYYAGTGDLDRYGHWEYVPGYDYVWAPYARPGWVPYSSGSWVWEPYWGWTWVSYEPWGWAPYHYGRWFCYRNSWVWWPGPVYAAYRPLWAPAYVSFFGFGFGGGGFGLGFGFGAGFGFGGSIGWLPIGPHDPFFPWYGRYRGSYNVVNVTNITNIRNVTNIGGVSPLATARQPVMSNLSSVLNNGHVRQGLTTVPAAQFGRGQIAATHQAVTPDMIKQGQFVAGAVPVVPTRASLSPVSRPANPAALPAHGNANQHFFAKTTPPAGPRPFTEQAQQVRQTIQQKGALAAERSTGLIGAPGATARVQAESSLARGEMTTGGAKTGPTPAGTAATGNRSASVGNESAGQSTRSQGASRPPSYDNEALRRLPETGFGRSQPPAASGGAQAAGKPTSQKPQGSPYTQAGTAAGHGAASDSNAGWHRFGDRPSAPGDRTQGSPATPHTAGQGHGGWQKFERPASSERSSPSAGSRSESTNPSWNRSPSRSESPAYGQSQRTYQQPQSGSTNPGWNRFPSRPESPSFDQSQRSYQRPLLEIRKPIVNERASPSYDGGSRGSAPSSSHSSSSSGSHSGGHGRR